MAGKETLPDNGVLLTLASLSRTRSLTLTGSELGTSTATVSRTLAAARAFFGDELFVRSGPRMVPTARMRALQPAVDAVLRQLEALSAPAVFDPAGIERTFRIAAADNGILAFVFPALKAVLEQAPGLRLEIIGINGDLFDDLRNGRLDLAVFPFDPIPPECRSVVLADEPDVLIVRSGHPLVRISRERGALTLEDLRAYPKVRISNVTHNFSAAVVRFHASLMAHEREGARITMPYFLAAPWIVLETDATAKILEKNARMLARYLPIEILPLPPGLAGRYERRVIWHENASGDPALMWLIAMLRSASAQEACAGSAQAGRLIGRPHEEKARRCRTKKRAASFRRRPDSRPGSITPSS